MKKAPLLARLLAFLIDVAFLLCVSLALFGAGLLGSMAGAYAAGPSGPDFLSGLSALAALFFFFDVFIFLFYFSYLTSQGEQTLGKAAFRLRVVARKEETPISLLRSLGRTVAYWASALPLLLGFVMAIPLRGLTFHDVLAGTMVVKED